MTDEALRERLQQHTLMMWETRPTDGSFTDEEIHETIVSEAIDCLYHDLLAEGRTEADAHQIINDPSIEAFARQHAAHLGTR